MNQRKTTWMRMAAALAAAAMVLAGCGGSGGSGAGSGRTATPKPADTRSAATIVTQVKAALRSASSVHMAGKLRSKGTAVGLDISLIRSGGFSGFIQSGGTELNIVNTGKRVYIRVTSAFLKIAHAPAGVCKRVCGKYIAAPPSEAKTITGDFSMSELLGSVSGALPRYVKGGTTTIAGQPALALHGSDGSTLYVAATGTPYPLRAIAPKPTNAGQLDFSQWNAVPPIAAPPPREVISLSQLVG
jgi:hypothetical protein